MDKFFTKNSILLMYVEGTLQSYGYFTLLLTFWPKSASVRYAILYNIVFFKGYHRARIFTFQISKKGSRYN